MDKKSKIKEERKAKIKANLDYANWIERYAETHPHFTNEDYLFSISDKPEDIENTKSLEAFYEIVDTYAKENYIIPETEFNRVYYKLEYNENNYSVGYIWEQEVIFFCAKSVFENKDNVMQINEIIENKKQIRASIIDLKMKRLNLLLSELKLANLNEQIIHDEVNKTYEKRK